MGATEAPVTNLYVHQQQLEEKNDGDSITGFWSKRTTAIQEPARTDRISIRK
jgi:hypothetical protein